MTSRFSSTLTRGNPSGLFWTLSIVTWSSRRNEGPPDRNAVWQITCMEYSICQIRRIIVNGNLVPLRKYAEGHYPTNQVRYIHTETSAVVRNIPQNDAAVCVKMKGISIEVHLLINGLCYVHCYDRGTKLKARYGVSVERSYLSLSQQKSLIMCAVFRENCYVCQAAFATLDASEKMCTSCLVTRGMENLQCSLGTCKSSSCWSELIHACHCVRKEDIISLRRSLPWRVTGAVNANGSQRLLIVDNTPRRVQGSLSADTRKTMVSDSMSHDSPRFFWKEGTLVQYPGPSAPQPDHLNHIFEEQFSN